MFLGEIIFWSGVNGIAEGRCTARLSKERAIYEHLGYLFKNKVCRAQVHDIGKGNKGESIEMHENYVAEEIMEESRKGVKRSNMPGVV